MGSERSWRNSGTTEVREARPWATTQGTRAFTLWGVLERKEGAAEPGLGSTRGV